MPKNIVAYFCGTCYDRKTDLGYKAVQGALVDKASLVGYNGCHERGGGIFAYGVEEPADHFVSSLRNKITDTESNGVVKINMIAHSRGGFSALAAILKIQADPVLSKKVEITVDLRGLTPGNLQATVRFFGKLALANQFYDLSKCTILKKAYMTVQEDVGLPFTLSVAFDELIPIFPPGIKVLEIEALPGLHDSQQRVSISSKDSPELITLGDLKTLSILEEDGNVLEERCKQKGSLEEQQLKAYDLICEWAQGRIDKFSARSLHFGGSLISNNTTKDFDVINWRHARLKFKTNKALPKHVLHGVNHPHYTYRKSPLEHYCDLTLVLDKYLEQHRDKEAFVSHLEKVAVGLMTNQLTTEDYYTQCQQLLSQGKIYDKGINKTINYMLMRSFFTELDAAIAKHVNTNVNLVSGSLHDLKNVLVGEFIKEIETGKSIEQISCSKIPVIAKNTAVFIEKIYQENDLEKVIQSVESYTKQNIRLAANLPLSAKIITGAIIAVAAAVTGSALSLGIVFGFGMIPGAGALLPTFISILLGTLNGMTTAITYTGLIAGFGAGVYGACTLFKLSPVEQEVKNLSARVRLEKNLCMGLSKKQVASDVTTENLTADETNLSPASA